MARENFLEDYVTVNERIMEFYEKYPTGRITTEIVSLENGVVVIKSYAYRNAEDTLPSATGHAYEKEGSSFINKTSFIENAETSSVGRCIANLGIAIKKSVASYEEVANAKLNQAEKKLSKEVSTTELKKKWQELAGSLDGFDSFYDDRIKQGFTNGQLDEFLDKKLKAKGDK